MQLKSHTITPDSDLLSIPATLNLLRHHLPTQAPLKDFIHHNPLHAFQHVNFNQGVREASRLFGNQVYLKLNEYRSLFHQGKISEPILDVCIKNRNVSADPDSFKKMLLEDIFDETLTQKTGRLRAYWKNHYKFNMNKAVHANLFRLIGAYLDQGVGISGFPGRKESFLEAVRYINDNSYFRLFKSKRVNRMLQDSELTLEVPLQILVGKASLFQAYLYDQQFEHPGWSGMVAYLEANHGSLFDKRNIKLEEFILVELLLEINALDRKLGENWKPLGLIEDLKVEPYLEVEEPNILFELYATWQNAYEWSYYDTVIKGLQLSKPLESSVEKKAFQAVFCIDDRSCSIRRYLEKNDPTCETFGTAGFFNVPVYFQPEHGKFHTKLCPAPQTPVHLIKESESKKRHNKRIHFNRHTYGLFGGWITAPTLGFASALKMAKSILLPSETDALVSSFNHMDRNGKLRVIKYHKSSGSEKLQHGFTEAEMADRVEGLLKSIGMVDDIANIVYIIGHGASSVNNTHYAGYDCGACSGRPGSVNARVSAIMANNPNVRKILLTRGMKIPDSTQFVGGLHDTTRDEMEFYDIAHLSDSNQVAHQKHLVVFEKSLVENAKERARRFIQTKNTGDGVIIHRKVKDRSISLFEPRPEWNHATNAICIIGKRASSKHLFLDRRAFLNSYDHALDVDGTVLLNILNAIAPVCGGINLEYYFSRVDNNRLGAGTKLPHNVMGLIGVANGMDGDLRTGLPKQMINIHDPLRLLVLVEQEPEKLLHVMKANPATFQWFENNWIHIVSIHPNTRQAYVFKEGIFCEYKPKTQSIPSMEDLDSLLESSRESLPVHQMN